MTLTTSWLPPRAAPQMPQQTGRDAAPKIRQIARIRLQPRPLSNRQCGAIVRYPPARWAAA